LSSLTCVRAMNNSRQESRSRKQESRLRTQKSRLGTSYFLLLASWAWLRLSAHSAAGGAAGAAGTGFGGGCGRRGHGDGKDRQQLIDIRARALLTGHAGGRGTDYSLKLCPTLTALVFEYGHRSISVFRTPSGCSLSDYSGREPRFQPDRTLNLGFGISILS